MIDGVRLKDKACNFVASQEIIRPLRDQVIIKPLPLPLGEKIRVDWNGETVRGEVVAVGPGCYPNIHKKGFKDGKPYHIIKQSRIFRPTEVKVGDVVSLGGMEIGGYLFPKVFYCGDWCVIAQEADVAVIE